MEPSPLIWASIISLEIEIDMRLNDLYNPAHNAGLF